MIMFPKSMTSEAVSEVTGKICVIGSKLDEDKLAELFRK